MATLSPDTIRIDTLSRGVPMYNAEYTMTLTHVPTGKQVTGSGPRGFLLRIQLLEELTRLVEAG